MEMKTARQWLPSTEEMLANRGSAPEMPINSIPKLDTFLWGLHRKQLIIIAARPSNGKSILAVQLGWDMVKQGKSVYFMSLEMTCERIMERIFSNEFLVDNDYIMRGGFTKDVILRKKWEKFKEILKTSRFVMSDMIGRNVQDIHAIDKAFEKKPDVLIIDHLNEIGGDQKKSAAIEKYLDTLRAMAIRSNVALVICCQVNRTSQTEGDKTPQLHQLKGCIHPDSIVTGKKIKDRVCGNDYSEIKSLTEDGNIVYKNPSRLIKSGIKECLRVRTKSGKEIILSTETMIKTKEGWKKAKDICIGEQVIVDSNQCKFL